MKQTLNAFLSVVIISIMAACSAGNNLTPTASQTTETALPTSSPADTAAAETAYMEPVESSAITAANSGAAKPQEITIADYVPRYENAVYVYEIQSADALDAAVQYRVRLDYVKDIDGITAAQFTRYNDAGNLYSYLIIYEKDSIYSLQASFAHADELTSESLNAAKKGNAYFSLLNQPLDQPHQWEDWYTQPTGNGEVTHIRNWMSASEIIHPDIPVETLLGTKQALEVIEYYEEQSFGRRYYVPLIGLVRLDSVMPEEIVTGSEVLIRIENFNREYDGQYYETLEVSSSKITG